MKRGVYLAVAALVAAAPSWGGDGVVALQTAAPSCANDSGDRYVPCGNGTVTDNDTGLVWLQNANCIGSAGGGSVDWHEAMEFAAGLSDLPGVDSDDCGLEDGSSPGEWRLASKAEWQAMIADPVACSFPTITNDSGAGCWNEACVTAGDCSFSGVVAAGYWSSTTYVSNPSFARVVNLNGGEVIIIQKADSPLFAWPVRGGQ